MWMGNHLETVISVGSLLASFGVPGSTKAVSFFDKKLGHEASQVGLLQSGPHLVVCSFGSVRRNSQHGEF